jgi:SAM-dependent methyltransferase
MALRVTPNRSALVIFVLAMSVMILEVALTRVFSFITYHHMTYLVIGAAMLGFGAAGTYLSVRPAPADAVALDSRLARHAALFAAATVIAIFLIPKIPFRSMDLYRLYDSGNLVALLPITVLSSLPFFFGGVCVADLVSRAGPAIHRVYFADLVGSATGALVSVVLVNHAGAIAACILSGALALLGASLAAPRSRIPYLASAVVLAAVSPLGENPRILPLHVPPGKQLYGHESFIETVRWHVITRLDVGFPIDCNCSFGGALSRSYAGPPPVARLIFQDGSNLTGILHPTDTPRDTPVFGYYLQGAAYAIRPGAEGLVIGSGGGVDVMVALHNGARHVVAVDVNPKTMELVRGKYDDFAGHVFNGPDVEPVVSEGRHFLSRDARQFDVIQLSGVDTWAALASGAYALTENFIYTAEAFDQYLRHLAPSGILGFSRPYVDPPLETYKLSATALDALDRLNAKDPALHLAIISGFGQAADIPWAEMLVKRSPFTPEEMAKLHTWAQGLGFEVVYDPYAPADTPLSSLIRSDPRRREKLLSLYPLNIRPATDDVPFYFQYHRWRDLFQAPLGIPAPMAMWVLVGSFVQVLVLSALFILLPLYRADSRVRIRGGRAGIFFYFASLGMGFILVEIALLEKLTIFLGGPAYALSITLSTLLCASGMGSSFSARWAATPLRTLASLTPAIVGLIVLEAFLVEPATRAFMGLSLMGRAAAAIPLIAPLGFLLGMAFPTGLRLLDESRPELKPWAWGINACATVVGTSTCMLVVTSYGFRAALLGGAAVYGIGFLVLALSQERGLTSEASVKNAA